MADFDDENRDDRLFDAADGSVVADPIAPVARPAAGQRLRSRSRIVALGHQFQLLQYSDAALWIQPLDLLLRPAREFNPPRHGAPSAPRARRCPWDRRPSRPRRPWRNPRGPR